MPSSLMGVIVSKTLIWLLWMSFDVDKSCVASFQQCLSNNCRPRIVSINTQNLVAQGVLEKCKPSPAPLQTPDSSSPIVNVSRCTGSCRGLNQTTFHCVPIDSYMNQIKIPVFIPNHLRPFVQETLDILMHFEEHKKCQCVPMNSVTLGTRSRRNVFKTLKASPVAEDRLRPRQDLNKEVSLAKIHVNKTFSSFELEDSYLKEEEDEANLTSAAEQTEFSSHVYSMDRSSVEEFYQTCMACKKQQEICEITGQIFDSNVCHCVYPASKTFLNSFYTLGVVMLTVMVCCFLVFGVQKGDDNPLASRRRERERSSGSSHQNPQPSSGNGHHNEISRHSRLSTTDNDEHHVVPTRHTGHYR